jgi:hypothetical protein
MEKEIVQSLTGHNIAFARNDKEHFILHLPLGRLAVPADPIAQISPIEQYHRLPGRGLMICLDQRVTNHCYN